MKYHGDEAQLWVTAAARYTCAQCELSEFDNRYSVFGIRYSVLDQLRTGSDRIVDEQQRVVAVPGVRIRAKRVAIGGAVAGCGRGRGRGRGRQRHRERADLLEQAVQRRRARPALKPQNQRRLFVAVLRVKSAEAPYD